MADDIYVPRAELDTRFQGIEGRLAAVEKASKDMATAQATLTDTLNSNTEKLDHILGFLQHANTAWGFARRHGPRVVAFALGIAVTKGWVTAENGRNFLHIFGM